MFKETPSNAVVLQDIRCWSFISPKTTFLQLLCLLSILLTTAHISQPALAQTSDKLQNAQQSDDAEKLMQIFDTVISNHVNAPTRQQLVLEAIADLHDASTGRFDRKRWVAEISSHSDRDGLTQILENFLGDASIDFTVGKVSALSDLSVTLLPSKEANVSQQIAANRYVGIGVAIRKDGEQPAQFLQIVPGGTAESAGIQPGDLVIEADGRSMLELPLAEIIDCLRGPEGSELKLKVRSANGENERDLTLTRLVVPFKTVKEPVYSKSKKSVYLSLSNITASSVHELRQIAASLDDQVELVSIGTQASNSAIDLHHVSLLASGLFGQGTLGPLIKNDGTVQEFQLNGEPIFGNRKIVVVVDATSPGVWVWLAAAKSENNFTADANALMLSTQQHSRLKGQSAESFATNPIYNINAVFPPEAFSWHFQTVQIEGTELTATLPTGTLCDPLGVPVRPLNIPPQAPTILLNKLQP